MFTRKYESLTGELLSVAPFEAPPTGPVEAPRDSCMRPSPDGLVSHPTLVAVQEFSLDAVIEQRINLQAEFLLVGADSGIPDQASFSGLTIGGPLLSKDHPRRGSTSLDTEKKVHDSSMSAD